MCISFEATNLRILKEKTQITNPKSQIIFKKENLQNKKIPKDCPLEFCYLYEIWFLAFGAFLKFQRK